MQERGAAPPLSGEGRRRAPSRRRLLLAGVVTATVVAADQATKNWALARLANGPIHVAWKLDLSLTYNSGASFGLAQGWGPVVGAAAVVVVLGVLAMLRHVRSTLMAVALGLVLGGALGNLSDRVLRGHHGQVVDFVALHFWPTFNVADSCVVVGALLAGIALWRDDAGEAASP